jgi:hypothetical protein
MQAVFKATSENSSLWQANSGLVLILINAVRGYSVQQKHKNLPGTSATGMLELKKTQAAEKLLKHVNTMIEMSIQMT